MYRSKVKMRSFKKVRFEPYSLRNKIKKIKKNTLKTIKEDLLLSEDERYCDTLPASPASPEKPTTTTTTTTITTSSTTTTTTLLLLQAAAKVNTIKKNKQV